MSDPVAVRASDAEREQTVVRLREAAIEGRLTLEEFSQRVDSAYTAKTHDELATLTNDLPISAAPVPAAKRGSRKFTVAIFGGVERKGRWRATQTHWVFSIFGGSDLDFREASLDGGEATVYVLDLFGGTDLYVPDRVDVDFSAFALFGGSDEHGRDRPEPGAPVLHVRGLALFGGTDLWRVPAGARGKKKELRRAATAAERAE